MDIQNTTLTAEMFYLKSTFIYGESETGKGVIISNIMYELRNIVPVGFAFCPTDAAQGLYSKRTLPSLCVFSTITVDWLNRFWDRQTANAEIYRLANRIDVFESLFRRIPSSDTGARVAEMKRIADRAIRDTINTDGAESVKVENIKNKLEDGLRIVYRAHVNRYIRAYQDLDGLSDDELITLSNYNFNPDALLVIDDLSSEFKALCSCPFIGDMLTKGRHNRITLIVAIHGDSYVSKPLRMFPMIIIFTTAAAVTSFFTKLENFTSKQKTEITRATERIFSNKTDYKRIMFIRNTNGFMLFTADDRRMFAGFGSPAVFEYCEMIANSNNGDMDTELLGKNKFFQMMVKSSTQR